MSHTPGPWEAHGAEVTTRQIPGRSYRRIAAVPDYGLGAMPTVDEANARLIAAAPELLDVLRQCRKWVAPDVEHYEDGGGGDEWAGSVPLLRAINAAIAKAEGRSE